MEKPNKPNWFIVEKTYGEYNYLCMANSHRPFKSKGVYGFSHGGFTPQEVIIPRFIFRKDDSISNSLKVVIKNKKELGEVTGEIFGIKLEADTGAKDLFAFSRKVHLLLYADNIKCSQSNIINMEPGKNEMVEFSFNKNMTLKAVLLDTETQEQLDIVTIKKSNVRDLGGLL